MPRETSDKIIAIIPARGGSKGIPRKNVLDFCGKPLIAWTILQAVNTPQVDAVYVTSDSDEILDLAKKYGAKIIKRPQAISGDTATSESAVEHAFEAIGIPKEMAFMLQATSPLRKPDDLSRAIEQFRADGCDSGFSGAILEDFLTWRKTQEGVYESINYDYKNRGRRQDRPLEYVENGSIYFFKPQILLEHGNRLGGRIGTYLMEFWQSFEIDSPHDWDLLEILFKTHLGKYYSI